MTRARTVFAILLLAALAAAPGRAVAWEGPTHQLAGKILLPLLPPSLKAAAQKFQAEYRKGIDEEPELYTGLIEKGGKYDRDVFSQTGIQRLLYHLQRIQGYLDRRDTGALLAYETGQYIRCAADLFEPLPADTAFSPVEVSGTRIFFIADFTKNNPKFDFLYRGRGNMANLPAAADELLKTNAAAGDAIYRAYHSKRDYRPIDGKATAAFNRTLAFTVESLYAFDRASNSAQGRVIDMRQFLGINNISKYGGEDASEMKIKKPAGPKKPKAPDVDGAAKPENPDKKNGK